MIPDVKHLVDAGFSLLPLKPRTKRPIADNWTDLPTYSWKALERVYRDGQNLGVRLGKPSIVDDLYLYVVDLDIRVDDEADDAWAELEDMFPGVKFSRFPTVQSGSRGESRHIYFVSEGHFRSHKLAHSGKKFTDDEGKKHWTWEIELFGTGKQVALPPSIHPDTGKTYRWIREPNFTIGLPEIDADILEDLIAPNEEREPIYREPLDMTLDEAEDALAEIEDWAEDRDTWMRIGMGLKYDFGEDGWGLFDEWSQNSDRYEADENRKQWKSYDNNHPNPVTFRTALAEAHQRIRQRYIRETIELFEDFDDLDEDDEPEGGDRAPQDDPINVDHREILKDFPKHLLRVPGVLQDMVDYYNYTAIKPQPQFAVLAAIAIGSVVVARNHVTDWDNYSSLYLLAVGRSGSGKEHLRTSVTKVLTQAGLDDQLLGPEEYTSDAAVRSALLAKPRHLTIIDELGHYLKTARKSGDSHKEGVQKIFLSLSGIAHTKLPAKEYSTQGMTEDQVEQMRRRFVIRPGLSQLAMTTPDNFMDTLSFADVASGYLNRYVIVKTPIGLQSAKGKPKKIPASTRLIKWMQKTCRASADDGFELEDFPTEAPEPIVVPFSDQCHIMLDEIEVDITRRRFALLNTGMDELLGRTREITMRVALIVAVSQGRDEIQIEDLTWARDWVYHFHLTMVEDFAANLGRSYFHVIAEDCAKLIEGAGRRGLTASELGRKKKAYEALSGRDADEVHRLLERIYDIKPVKIVGKGPSRTAFVHPKHIKEADRKRKNGE